MKASHIAFLLVLAASGINPLYAQDKAPSARPVSTEDCMKEHDKHHDHAKERGAGAMRSKCMDDRKGARGAAKKPLHDHNKQHKAN